MVLESLMDWVSNLTGWANAILVGMLIYYGYLFVKGGTEGEHKEAKWSLDKLKGAHKKGPGWMIGTDKNAEKKNEALKQSKKDAKKEKTTALREYVGDEKYLKKLSLVDLELSDAEEELEGIYNKRKFYSIDEVKTLAKTFSNLKESLNDLKRNFRKLKKITWRQESKMEKLLRDYEEAGVDEKELGPIKVLEKNILGLHEESAKFVEGAEKEIEGISNNLKKSAKAKISGPINFTATTKKTFDGWFGKMENVKKNLEEAEDKQEKALENMRGIIAKIKPAWH
ncbi:hypothetical protein HOC13_02075 [Candidatus Woesearchaeota archaeon]|nr:hypothetical protein [Candidatus Woesearchaeota archaeon]